MCATAEKLLIQPDPGLYSFINQGELTIEGVDDAEEMKITDVRPCTLSI